MNFLYICGYAANYPGNFINSLLALNDEYKSRQSCMLLPKEAKDKEWIKEVEGKNIKVFYKEDNIISEFFLIKKICKENNIDVIYHHFWNLKDCLVAKFLCRKKSRIANIIHYHNEYHISSSYIKEHIKHWILNVDMEIGCGEAVTEGLHKAKYYSAMCVDNCIDFKRLDNYKVLKIGSDNTLKLLTFSSYGFFVKGCDISVKAVEKARKKYSNIELIIVVSEKMEELKQYVIEICNGAIPKWIKILPAISDVASYYHAVDAYLNSSRSEGFCYATIEAIYSGCQIIQSDTPGNRLDVPETFIFESEDIDGCAERIIRLQEQSIEERMVQKRVQNEYIKKKYSLETWVEQEKAILNNVVKQKRGE